VGDQIRLEQGKERISLIYALLSLAAKIAGALSALLSYPLLDAVGYHAKEGLKNSPEAIRHLELIYLAGPIFFVMIGGACFIGWRLDAVRHGQIRSELEARDALYDEAPVVASLGGAPVIAVVDKA
jgi:GPH family glycoside/pentoside/hexuronide:cation symporter